MAFKWTDEQQAIFDSHDKNILVSASAGSGKTTVMISKIIDLVLKENDRTPISNFLVVTFTKASAEDMKVKLIEAFSEYQDDEFCLKQMDDVEISDISNLHSFCSRLISTYFYEVNIDPSFQVLDGVHASFLQDKALDKLFERKEKQGDLRYFKLFEIFQKKRQNKPLKNIIKRFNNFLNASLDEKKWFDETLESAYNLDLSKNSCAIIINKYASKQMKKLSQEAEAFADVCLQCNQEKLHAYFSEISSCLLSVNLKNSFEINCRNIQHLKLPTAPRISADVHLKVQADELKARIKSQIENFQNNYISDDIEYLIKGLSESREIVVALYDMVKEFNDIYDEMKREINSLDFNDLEKKALQILKNPQIIDSLRKKYRYIFVDEYQDINSVQEEIISLVSGKNNRFMVGDVKQSIYRFRLCDPDIFLDKYEKYSKKNENSELFKLNCNFRSDKKILKFVDLIFSGVMTEDFGGIDYKKDSCFVPGEGNLDQENSVNLFFVDTTKEKQTEVKPEGVYSVKNHQQNMLDDEEKGVIEGMLVARTIAELIEKDGINNFRYSDVAVLVGSRNSMVMKFIETLKNCGIKVSSDEKFNLIDKVYIQEILNFVKLVCNRNNDFYLFKVLKSRLFNFSDDELVKIRLINPKIRFYECLKHFDNIEDGILKEKIRKFTQKIDVFAKIARVLSIKQFCKKIIEDFSLYQINDASEDGDKANYNIDLMINALPETDVFDFVLNYENFSLEVENECGGDTVSVMTIHKSKGIEFKYVFLINTSNEFNFESTYDSVIFNKQFGVGLDYFDLESRVQMPTIASSGIKLLEKRKLVEEQQRVLYVALTRAKEKLYVICSKEEDKLAQKHIEHKRCYADWFEPLIYKEITGNHNPLINFKRFESAELAMDLESKSRSIFFKDIETTKPSWYQYPYNEANQFRLKTSISKIIHDDKINNNFVGSGSSADRGTAYHEFLQALNLKSENLDEEIERLASEEKWKAIVDINLIKKLVKLPIFREIAEAKYILTEREFYSKLSTDEIKSSNANSAFILQGIIDLVAVFDDYLIVLDYKTGRMNDEKLKDYSFQLNIYSRIAEKIYAKKVIKKILCLIDEQKIIEI